MARQEAMTLLQFQEKFSDEQTCREHLFEIRWSEGFICPHCGHREYYNHKSRNLYQCKACGYQASVTAGTVMHKTRISLVKWFWAIFLVSHDKRGISSVRLEQDLGISYPSAWLMLHKIRKAMGDRDGAYQLAGLVEMDETYVGGPKSGGKRGRGTEKTKVLVAVSLSKKQKPEYVKMVVSDDITSDTLARFAGQAVREGSTISSDGYRSYRKAFSTGTYTHDPAKYDSRQRPEPLRWLHTRVANAKRFILGTYHGLDDTHFQAYLDTFCYRINRRFFAPQLFDRLLCACSSTTTITYKQLISETS
jgi:transposase-like protein